jgi:RNA polymerase sigma factor (sigma-70 family)
MLGGVMNTTPAPSWEPFLVAHLCGDKSALTNCFSTVKTHIARYVRYRAPYLPEDLREDVAQQVFVRLIQNPPAFDPGSDNVSSLLYGLVRNAITQVKAMFAPLGQRTRMRASVQTKDEDTARTAIPEQELNAFADVDEMPADIEQVKSHRWTSEQTESTVIADNLLSKLPERAASALWLVHADSMTVSDAARELGLSRFQVARDLKLAHTLDLGTAKFQPSAYESAA